MLRFKGPPLKVRLRKIQMEKLLLSGEFIVLTYIYIYIVLLYMSYTQ